MNITATGTITISNNFITVFNFIANLENDKFWRDEVNSTIVTSSPGINAMAKEDSFLSKRIPSNILNLICITYCENKQIVYETEPNSKFFLKTIREVLPISQNETRVVYSIEFDMGIVKHGLGFSLPKFLVGIVARRDMKKYLKKLKTILENMDTIT